jgi:murein L,D-transpeptidase YcbB/YkuD
MRTSRPGWLALAFAMFPFASTPPVVGQQSAPEVTLELEWRIEQLRAFGVLEVRGEEVRSGPLTLSVYEHRGFAPVWSDPAAVGALLQAIGAVERDGLDSQDYHPSALALARSEAFDPPSRAELDLLATDAFVRIAHDLRFGKAQPQGPAGSADGWLFDGADAAERVAAVVASNRVRETLSNMRPRHFVYVGLTRALAELEHIREAGGWQSIPRGVAMGRDSIDARVPSLRRRLAVEGDLDPWTADSGYRFDATLEAAVKSFQHRHGLNEDGRVGEVTLAALNVPVEQRIDQVRVNLERARWVAHVLPDTFVVVNVAGAKVYVLYGDSVVFESRGIVGRDYSQTPIFTAPMRYLDLNPTWTVPTGIVGEVLDQIRLDPGYLERNSMKILDSIGGAVDPGEVDLRRYTEADFPYVLRQEPGPTNPLGRIKFMFPNEHDVYLHDTPRPELFGREERLFSHGCIRVENPLALAELVLGDSARWNPDTLREAIATGDQQTIRLPRPIPVFVLYWTAATDADGTLHFHEDVYHRDAAILAVLDAGHSQGTVPDRER